jgi:NitT/TauT family transport system ATP-binding protein
MSKGPGRIISQRRVNLPRPRTIATRFEPAFVEVLHALRHLIFEARS